jgi:hypothetical protein
MAKRTKRAELFGKLGFASSMISAIGGVGTSLVILHRWNFANNIIITGGTVSTLVTLALAITFVLGAFGFVASLEGAANGEGKSKSLGWTGYWVGAVFTMVAIIMGLCFKLLGEVI